MYKGATALEECWRSNTRTVLQMCYSVANACGRDQAREIMEKERITVRGLASLCKMGRHLRLLNYGDKSRGGKLGVEQKGRSQKLHSSSSLITCMGVVYMLLLLGNVPDGLTCLNIHLSLLPDSRHNVTTDPPFLILQPPIVLLSCFSAMMDCTLKLKAKTNSSFL